jgi:hypothetical protein
VLTPLILISSAHSAQISLRWDPNKESNLGGYYVYYGTSSRDYKYKVNVNKNTSCSISNLSEGTKYYFAVTAYDVNQSESTFSAEISSTINSNNESIFVDVPSGFWAEESIYKIFDVEITNGCSQNPLKYCPNDKLNRSQAAVMLIRAKFGKNYIPPSPSGLFDDVPINYWASEWIEKLYKENITNGCNSKPLMYCPEMSVNRAQMAVFLLRSKHGPNYTPPSASGIFTDVPINYWAADWIEQLYKEGITKGCKSNPMMYCPEMPVNRSHAAVFMVRAFGL